MTELVAPATPFYWKKLFAGKLLLRIFSFWFSSHARERCQPGVAYCILQKNSVGSFTVAATNGKIALSLCKFSFQQGASAAAFSPVFPLSLLVIGSNISGP